MRPRDRAWIGLLALCLCWANGSAAWAQELALAGRLDAVFDDPLLASASVGVLVVETASGRVLYERDADRALVPASNMKLVTSLAALHFLGPGFRYTTGLGADSPPNPQGWIVGDLYLRGSGDPTLTHEDLDTLAVRLAAAGTTRVNGDLVADASCFPGAPLGLGWSWSDQTYAYSAQISGLAVDGNVVRAEVVGGTEPGDPCELRLTPPSDHLTLADDCRTGAKDGERPRLFRRRAENVLAASGPVPAGSTVSATVSLEDSGLYVATLLRGYLVAHGIRVDGGCRRGKTPATAVTLVTYESARLRDTLAMMNVPSDNGIAEALLCTIPLASGRAGTASEGTAMVEEWLPEIGVLAGPLRLCDGSGLSRLNLLTPRALVGILTFAANSAELGPTFVASLPVVGAEGTVRGRMQGTAAEGRVRAKTGSLWGVSALSGYVEGAGTCSLTFSMLMNNYTCEASDVRQLQDRACVILAEHVQP